MDAALFIDALDTPEQDMLSPVPAIVALLAGRGDATHAALVHCVHGQSRSAMGEGEASYVANQCGLGRRPG
jgi:protein-tyrosine phosphatase